MRLLTLYRIGRWCYLRRVPLVPALMYYLIRLLHHASIPMSVEIGVGTEFAHGGLGVVLHQRCRIGKNVMISHQVTVGGRSGLNDVPIIEDNCYIGTGARVLGPVVVGTGSGVGANAVVIHDVPPHSVVAGVPARVIRSNVNILEYC